MSSKLSVSVSICLSVEVKCETTREYLEATINNSESIVYLSNCKRCHTHYMESKEVEDDCDSSMISIESMLMFDSLQDYVLVESIINNAHKIYLEDYDGNIHEIDFASHSVLEIAEHDLHETQYYDPLEIGKLAAIN